MSSQMTNSQKSSTNGMITGNKMSFTRECDKLWQNNYRINPSEVLPVQNKSFERLETEQKGTKVVLEFPQEPIDKESVEEVKTILTTILQEYFKNNMINKGE